jgi:biopolymer transport protein ExbB
MDSFITFMQDGGIFMYFILGTGIFAAAIACERLFHVTFRANINAGAFMSQIQKYVMANNIDRAIKLCNAEPHAVLPKVVKAGLTRANRTEKEIESAIEETSLEVVPSVTKRTGFLPMLANVSTLLGLLGTIQGLVQAFDAVANASAESKATLLANGIAVAMYTTAFGLIIAIPVLVIHSFIQARTNAILDDIDTFSLKTLNLLTARRRGTLKEDGEVVASS